MKPFVVILVDPKNIYPFRFPMRGLHDQDEVPRAHAVDVSSYTGAKDTQAHNIPCAPVPYLFDTEEEADTAAKNIALRYPNYEAVVLATKYVHFSEAGPIKSTKFTDEGVFPR